VRTPFQGGRCERFSAPDPLLRRLIVFSLRRCRLERTIFTTDGGRQVRISDVWRSTDRKAHTISAHNDQFVQGDDPTPPGSATLVGLKLPWISSAYKTFTIDQLISGPKRVPQTVFVRDDNTAPAGSLAFPRGAIGFDYAPHVIHRVSNEEFTLRDDNIKVRAGGAQRVREYFVMGTSDAQVAAKAAGNRKQLG
jgi:hypothetical protein